MRVLIVDDDPSLRTVVCRILSRHLDVDIVECGDGIAALEALAADRYSLVLLDMNLPGLDGMQVLRAIRASPSLSQMPVMMMTGRNELDSVSQVLDAGVQGYIVKPLRPGDLYDRVGAVLAAIRAAEMPAQQARRAFEPLLLDDTTPVLVVDGDEEFRNFFVKTVGRLCPVTDVASGVEALKLCQEAPPYAVFIGSDIGLLHGSMLARNLRTGRGTDTCRIIGIMPPRLVLRARKESSYEAVIMRSFVPEVFMDGFAPLRHRPARLSGLLASVPDLKLIGIAASEEALTSLLGTQLVLRPATPRANAPRSLAAAMVLSVGTEGLPLRIELTAPQRGLARVVEQLHAHGVAAGADPAVALYVLVERIGELLARELEGRGLTVTNDGPFTIPPPSRQRSGLPLGTDEMTAMAFDVEGPGIAFRLALDAGEVASGGRREEAVAAGAMG